MSAENTDHAKRVNEIEAWATRNGDTASIEDAGVGDLTEEIAIGVEAVRDLLAQLRAASEALTAAGVPDDGRPLAERIRFLREDATGRRRDEVLAVIDGWVGHYPADVFPPDGTSIDAKSGTFARHLLGLVRGQLVKVFDGGEDPGIAAATERCARGEHRKGGEYSGNSCADCGTDFSDLDTEPTSEDLARGAAVFAQMGSREATITRLAERDPAFAADVAWLNLDPASTERHWQGAMALLRARGVNVDAMLAQAAKNLEGVTPEVARPRAASVHGPVDPGLDVEEPARRGVEQAESDDGDPGSEGAHDGSVAATTASRKENRHGCDDGCGAAENAPRPPLTMIVAIARGGVIGAAGGLPWPRISEDLRHFKRETWGHTLIVGRRTAETLPPLDYRRVLVVSRAGSTLAGSAHIWGVAPSFEAALDAARGVDPHPVVIGGAEVYRAALPFVTRILLTEIDADHEGDTFFHLDRTGFVETERRAGETPGVSFVTLERAPIDRLRGAPPPEPDLEPAIGDEPGGAS